MLKKIVGYFIIMILLVGVGLYANNTKVKPYAVQNEIDVVGGGTPQFKFANNAKTKIKRELLTTYIKDNNDQAFPNGIFATGTFSTTTSNIINLDSTTGSGEELNLNSVGEGSTDFSIQKIGDPSTNYIYSAKVGDVETHEVYVGDVFTTQLILNTYKDNFGNVAGSDYYAYEGMVCYPDDMLDTSDVIWTFKTPGIYTLIIGAGNPAQMSEKKAFMYTFEVKERIAIEEITIDKRAYRSVGHTNNIIDAGYYHVSPEDADANDVTLTPEDPNIAYIDIYNDVFAYEYGHTKIKIASKADPNVNADLDYYVTAGIEAYVGHETENEMPYYDDEGEVIEEGNITSITSENPEIFTVSYTQGEDMKLTGLKAGVGKIKLVEDTGGTYPKYHYLTVESFASIKDGQVNQKWSITYDELKNAKNINGYPYNGGEIDSDNAYAWSDNDEIELTVNENGISFTPETTGPWTIWFQTENGESYEYYVNVIDVTLVENITLDKTTLDLQVGGETDQLTATVLPENATIKDVNWISEDTNVATVDEDGVVTPVGNGSTNIYAVATDGSDVESNLCLVTVTDNILVESIILDKTTLDLQVGGETDQLSATVLPEDATIKDVNWISEDTNVATVDEDGVVTPVGNGSTNIYAVATDGSDVESNKCAVTVIVPVESIEFTDYPQSMTVDDIYQLGWQVLPEDATYEAVTFETSDYTVATVDTCGIVTAVGAGKVTITCKSVSNPKVTATCAVTVKDPIIKVTSVKVTPTTLSINKGKTYTLKATVYPTNATDKTVTWKSSNTKVATVTNGVVKGIGNGTATITVTTKDGNKTATCKVTVKVPVTGVKLSSTSLSIVKGKTATLKATITPSDATVKTVTWKSSNTKVATVSTSGVVKGIAKGVATITVTTKDGNKTAKCKVTVTEPVVKVTGVKLSKTSLSLAKGKTATLTVTVLPTNATNKAVTWKSSNTKIATVSTSGVVKAISNGSATITVTTTDGKKTATCKVTVK